MHDVDRRLADWAARATPAERRAGPTVDDLGGMQAVADAADHLAAGPFLPHLIQAAAHQHTLTDADTAILHEAIVAGLRRQRRHSAFASAVDILAARPALARALGTALPRALLARLTAAQDAGDDPAAALIGAEAAECLLQLTLAGITRAAQFLGTLDAVTEDAAHLPEPFAARLPRLLGVLDAHHPGTGLREALERFLLFDHTCRDAAFELAMADLRNALQAPDEATMRRQLVDVRRRLAELISGDPDRLDAQLYHAAIDAALTLSAPDASTHVPAVAATMRDTLHRYRSWRRNTHTPAWGRPRQHDITAWAELTTVLDAAAAHLADDDPWYGDGHVILTALLRAYTADKTVTVVTDTTAGPAEVAETLIAPVIEDTFLRRENRIAFLRHALEHDEILRTDPAALRLSAVLSKRTPQSTSPPSPPAGDGPGKARRWHLLAQTLTPAQFADLAGTAHEDVLNRIELSLRTREDVLAQITDVKFGRLTDDLIGQLQQSADWIPGIADPFQALLTTTLKYALMCYDISRKMGGSYTEYLRLRDTAKKKQKVDEALFHQHYYEVLKVSALFQVVAAEVIDHAGGRVDILVSFGTVHFNVECKIEEDDASEDGLRRYAAQAAEYQNTNAAFAILLVLDKTDHAEGTVNFFDSVWIEKVQRPGQSEPCHVVTIRVPGGRDDPNLLRTPAR